MERLTLEGNFCDIAQCRELPCPHNGSCSQRKVWERLKAYEDTGLEPWEVKRSKLEIEAGCVKAIARTYGIDINRLRKLAEADKDDRLVVLPCKVGDTLWVTDCGNVPRKMKLEAPGIIAVCTDEDNLCMWSMCNRKPDGFCVYRLRNDGADIGKTVFLTREEAERAMEEGERHESLHSR